MVSSSSSSSSSSSFLYQCFYTSRYANNVNRNNNGTTMTGIVLVDLVCCTGDMVNLMEKLYKEEEHTI